jgi:hypothetical protein
VALPLHRSSVIDPSATRLPTLRLQTRSRLHGHPVMLAHLRAHDDGWSVIARRCTATGLPAFPSSGAPDEERIRLTAAADVKAYELYEDSGAAVVRLEAASPRRSHRRAGGRTRCRTGSSLRRPLRSAGGPP